MIMIRKPQAQETDGLLALIAEGSRMPTADAGSILESHDTLIYETGGVVQGLVCTKTYSRDYGILLYVAPRFRGQGIGLRLYHHVRPQFDGPGPDRLTATYRTDVGHAREFFAALGFAPWYGMVYLSYEGGPQPEPSMQIRQYDDSLYEPYITVLGRSFYEMRRSHGFEPYDVEGEYRSDEARARLLSQGADIYVGFDQAGTAVGCAAVEGDKIEVIGVAPEHQGHGYGRDLTRFSINLLLQRGLAPRTAVVEDNLRAKQLYLALGFAQVEIHEDAVLQLGKDAG
jgi:GNAT superfamily N-acetyltransferase